MKSKAEPVQPRLAITEWNESERPREKFMERGASSLTKAELLAILIGSGTSKETSVDLMRRMLRDHGDSLQALGRMSLQELLSYKGIGEAKAITIMAACELGKRRMSEQAEEKTHVTSSRDLYDYFRPRMMDLNVEQCHMLLLDTKNQVMGYEVVSTGGISSSVVDPRVVLRQALLASAPSLAICHNHPSGNVKPSHEDDNLTHRMSEACQAIGLRFVDHIVLGDGDYYSYFDNGKI
ncbi:MAG: DNA repair protein RadC [Bacteroidales bacterium]|nr:DNA repair protein RadC [Candidatus Physcousia equi]